ncbi:MAG: tetratricopeptide repeat protein, partial [Fuerstiella sp.]
MKFCCQDILADLVKVEKLIDSQPDAAEKLLRSLMAQHTDKEILVTQLVSVLTRKGQFDDARHQLVDFLRRHPDEPRALLSLADVCLATEGFAASRRIIHRAFQLGARQFPAGVAMLASQIAQQMARAGCAMSVREHLALSVRMAPAERRNALLMQLANFESQRTVPYPFRGRFALLPVELDEELQKEEQRARKVSQIGCWEPAAILYSRLVEKQPQNGALWHNLGLFRAWDGRIPEAAEALHKAADLIDDFDTAVETEALAQLLDLEVGKDGYAVVQASVPVESVSQLLTSLDADSRLVRMPANPNDENAETARVAAEYELLADPLPDEVDPDNLPDVLADITVYDADESSEADPQVLIVALDDDIKEATALFHDVAGDLAQSDEESEPVPVSRMP